MSSSAIGQSLGTSRPVLQRLLQNLGPVVVRGLALCLAFGLQILLARALGPAGYGIYSLAFSVLLLIIIVALQGHDIGAMRIAAPLIASDASAQLDEYRAAVNKRIWVVGTLIALGTLLFSFWAGKMSNEFWQVMILMVLSLPFVARSRFSQGILRAGGKPTQAYLPEGVIPPLFMIPLIALLAYFSESSVTAVGGIFLLAAVGNWLFAIVLERRAVPALSDSVARKTSHNHPDWKKITAPIYLSALLAVANDKVVFLLLGAMEGEYAAGLYTAASRFMIIAGMIGTTLYLSHASRISVLYGKGDSAGLAAEVGHITRLVIALTLAICIPLMIWAEFFLSLFGSQFAVAVIPFRLLVLATFINVAMGPVGLLLNMSAFERTHTRILAVSLALSVSLGVAFIHIWDVGGAALAVLISTLFWNGALLYVVRKRFGIIPVLARSSASSA